MRYPIDLIYVGILALHVLIDEEFVHLNVFTTKPKKSQLSYICLALLKHDSSSEDD